MDDGTPVQCLIVELLTYYMIKYKLELLMHKLLAIIYLRHRPYY
jgi:hypothetical protein